MLEVYSILCMYYNIQLITNIIDLIQKLFCIPDLDKIDFDLICHKIDKSDKGEYSICTLQTNYTRQHRLFINYVNINDAYHLWSVFIFTWS
jgi:hypothetical protein